MSQFAARYAASERTGRNRPLIVVAALMLASFTVGFDTREFSVGLADLRGAFGLSVDQASWLSTFAAAPQIFVAPAVAWFVAAFGVRRVIVAPCLVYALVSFLIPLMHGFGILVALHIVRALLLGVFIPATIGITLRSLDKRFWLIGLAIYSLRLPFSQNAGVFIVGYYREHLGLQWLYWQDVIVTPIVALLICYGAVKEPIDREMLRKADWGGMLLLGSSMFLLYVGLDQGERLNWLGSGTIVCLLVAGIALGAAFFANESVVKNPWAHIHVLESRNQVLSFAALVAFIVAGTPTSILIPGYLETVVGLRPAEIGRLYLPFAIAPLFVSTAASVIFLRFFDVRWGLVAGFSLMALGALLATQLTSAWSLENFMVLVPIQIIGQGLTILSAIVVFLANSNPKHSMASSAYVQVVRLGGAEIAASLLNTLVVKREQFHSGIIGQSVTAASLPTRKALSVLERLFQTHTSSSVADALVTLAGHVRSQAYVMAYADGFFISFWAAVSGLILTSLMIPAPKGPLTPDQ